jgi:flagellar hook-basal body complex protein FliE
MRGMRNLPQILADLEFKDPSEERVFPFESPSLKKVLHRHFKDKNLHDMQRKIAEEYNLLQEAALEMGEAEDAFHKMMQARQKLVDVYRGLMVRSQTNDLRNP